MIWIFKLWIREDFIRSSPPPIANKIYREQSLSVYFYISLLGDKFRWFFPKIFQSRSRSDVPFSWIASHLSEWLSSRCQGAKRGAFEFFARSFVIPPSNVFLFLRPGFRMTSLPPFAPLPPPPLPGNLRSTITVVGGERKYCLPGDGKNWVKMKFPCSRICLIHLFG